MGTTMRTAVRRSLVVLLLGTFGLGLGACNTMRGLGKDTQVVGEKIEDKAERHLPADQADQD